MSCAISLLLFALSFLTLSSHTFAENFQKSSEAGLDGWTNSTTINNTSNTLIVGDDIQNKQYKSIISFAVYPQPADVNVYQAFIKLKPVDNNTGALIKSQKLGQLFAYFGETMFGKSYSLQSDDFQSIPEILYPVGIAGTSVDPQGYVRIYLNSYGRYLITNTHSNHLQYRLEFSTATNNDNAVNQAKFYSGNSTNKPKLVSIYNLTPTPIQPDVHYPYECGTDKCKGYRCIIGNQVRPNCYNVQELPQQKCTYGQFVYIPDFTSCKTVKYLFNHMI